MKRNLLGISLITISGLYFLLAALIILATIVCDIPVIYGIGVSIAILIIQFLTNKINKIKIIKKKTIKQKLKN